MKHRKPTSKRIRRQLFHQTLSIIDRVTRKGNQSRFIDRAVLHHVETTGKHSLREQLKAGYRANAERDIKTAAAWFSLQEEAWERLEKTTRKPARM